MRLVYLIIGLLVSAVLSPLIVSSTADTINVNVTLIVSPFQYPMTKVENPYVYINQVLTEGHLPLLIEVVGDKNLDLNKGQLQKLVTHQVSEQYGNKDITYEIKLLVNSTYSYQTPVFKTEEYYYKTILYDNITETSWVGQLKGTREVIDYYETEQDYIWVWKPIKNINELTVKQTDFLIVDIQGNMKAQAGGGGWGVDVTPTIEIGTFKQSYLEYAWWDNGWNCSKEFMVDYRYVNGTLNNFPILFQNTSDDFKNHLNSNAYDIRFVTADNSSEYYFEIDHYNSSTGNLSVWVNLTTVYDTNETVVWIYYNNTGADFNPNSRETWHTNYKAVYHMDEASGLLVDSSTYQNNATATLGTPVYGFESSGVGLCIYYSSNEGHTIPKIATNAEWDTGYAVEGWGRFDNGDLQSYAVLLDEAYIHSMLVVSGTRRLRHYMLDDGAGGNFVYSSQTYVDDTWYYGISSYDQPYELVEVWTDGQDHQTAANINGGVFSETSSNTVGNDASLSYGTEGYLDEIRCYLSGNLGEDWIATTHHSVNSPETFLNVSNGSCPGPPAPTVITITVTSPFPANESTHVCPCINATCINVTISSGTLNITFYFSINNTSNFIIVEFFLNVPNGSYCFCLCAANATRYNETYYWYVNATEYNDDTNYNQSGTYWFTTAPNPAHCDVWTIAESRGPERSYAEPIGIFALIVSFLCLIFYLRRRR